jgi:hypothetical protein
MIQKFLPKGPKSSTMSYEIYRNRNSTETDFRLISDMYERVMREDKVLCTNAQRNLERGVFVNGQLHPKYEKAPLFFQETCREVVTEHYEKEVAEGREIAPAKQSVKDGGEGISASDESICAGLACGSQRAVLAW